MVLEIVSPEKKLTMENVSSITLPAGYGEMCVLDNHAPAIVITEKGNLKFIAQDAKQMVVVLLNKGFAYITQKKTIVILEEF